MDLQVDQPDFAAASGCTASPRSPALVHQICTDRQIDENHVQTIIQTLFSSEKATRFFANSARSNSVLLTHISLSVLKSIT
jgi:hypothetical protein